MNFKAYLQRVLLIITVLLGGGFSVSVHAVQGVSAEIYQGEQPTQAPPRLKALTLAGRGLNALPRAISMTLAEPSTTELQALLKPKNQKHKAFQVGIARSVPQLPELAYWPWLAASGGRAAHMSVTSKGALRIRALIQLTQPLPHGVELRVYAPEKLDTVLGVFTQKDFIAAGESWQFWTPTLEGETFSLEVFLPEDIEAEQVKLTVPQISHVAYDLKSASFKDNVLETVQSQGCEISLACQTTFWQQTGLSVARYIFTNRSGDSYLCSGTLLADRDSITQIPYFLTAAHCIADSYDATTMELFWFYQETSCGSGEVTWIQTDGGAEALAIYGHLDSSFVRLRNQPPAGVMMAGWALDGLPPNTEVVGLHHASGHAKQFSRGQFKNYARIELIGDVYKVLADDQGDFAQVVWQEGITAPGSSGSGLWTLFNGQPYLKGSLVGGSSSCNATIENSDEYTRIERLYPYIRTWLDQTMSPLKSLIDATQPPTALVDAVIISRYMDNKRGEALVAGVIPDSQAATLDLNGLALNLIQRGEALDIDGDGHLNSQIDGLLLARYLAGLKSENLLVGLNLENASRNNLEDITTYLKKLLGE